MGIKIITDKWTSSQDLARHKTFHLQIITNPQIDLHFNVLTQH